MIFNWLQIVEMVKSKLKLLCNKHENTTVKVDIFAQYNFD